MLQGCVINMILFCYREVSVVRLISKDTVEEGMLRVARGKLKLEKDITTDESKLHYTAIYCHGLPHQDMHTVPSA